MVTIKDVAKEANVSTSTVSKVLKGYPNISEATKKQVMDAVSKLGYVPNALASALSSKNFNRVGVWINFNNQRQAIDELNMQYIFGAFSQAKKSGLELKPLFSHMFSEMNEKEVLTYFKSEGINALIVFGLNINNRFLINIIEKEHMKCVFIDAPRVKDYTSSISINNKLAQYEIAKLIMEEHQCKKILYLAGRKDGFITFNRIEGIKQLRKESHVLIDIEYADFSEALARKITLQKGSNYDGIVCASDLMAIGAKNALKEMNIFRPVTGFDGITLMGYAGDKMYTVKQDFYNMGEETVIEMSSLLNGNAGRDICLPHKIVRIDYEDIII